MTYIISTIIVLGILIFVHELGHFLMAKAMGVRVEKFSLGFPPKMISRKYGETEYTLSWVPLGGYVRMFGEDPYDQESVPEHEVHRSFSHKPPWARFLIVAAGPVFNLIFAVLIFSVVFASQGIPHLGTVISEVQKDMPAETSGIQANDKIIEINGQPVKYYDQVSKIIQASEGKELFFIVLRAGREVQIRIMPKVVMRKNIFGEEENMSQVGIVFKGDFIIEKVGLASGLYHGAVQTWDVIEKTILVVVKLIQRKIPFNSVGGPIFIAQLAGQQAKAGIMNVVFLLAVLSVNLGIINLFPIPILDGGHLFFFGLEMVFRKPISVRAREVAQQAGLVLLVLFMVAVFYNDLDRIFSLSKFFTK